MEIKINATEFIELYQKAETSRYLYTKIVALDYDLIEQIKPQGYCLLVEKRLGFKLVRRSLYTALNTYKKRQKREEGITPKNKIKSTEKATKNTEDIPAWQREIPIVPNVATTKDENQLFK